jgi:DNA polymerase III subunit epsilon
VEAVLALTKLSRPIVFFDLETTGLLVDIDYIIEIALIKFFPDGRTLRLTQRFDPGIKIPAESSAIHGITNQDLSGQPRFIDMAEKLYEIFNDADLGGFALRRLDIPMLTKEFERAGYSYSMVGRNIVDVSAIFREKERRDLTAAYKFYCGKDLIGAHGAEADNDATYEILLAQLQRYPDLPRDVEGLNTFCRAPERSHVDQEGKLIWRDGEAYFSFGKHRYKSLADVARSDRDYLDWIINRGDFPEDFVNICLEAKRGIYPRRADAEPKPH